MQLFGLIEMALICQSNCLGRRKIMTVVCTEDLSEPGKQLDNHQDSNAAFLNKTRLELILRLMNELFQLINPELSLLLILGIKIL